jgi:hypothetical protein
MHLTFDHCGLGLAEVVKNNEWGQKHGVKTGGDYF